MNVWATRQRDLGFGGGGGGDVVVGFGTAHQAHLLSVMVTSPRGPPVIVHVALEAHVAPGRSDGGASHGSGPRVGRSGSGPVLAQDRLV